MEVMVNIAVTIDRKYLQPAGVMLSSLFRNTSSDISIYLLHPDLREEDENKLRSVVAGYANARIEFIKVDPAIFSDFVVTGHFSAVMYYKLCFGMLLPERVERIIYIDPDTLVLSDIQELWEADIGEALYLAVPLQLDHDIEHIVQKEKPYHSCGVMLVDVAKWRRECWDEKLLKVAHDLAGKYDGAPEMQILAAGTSEVVGRMPIYWNWWPLMNGYSGSFSKDDLKRIKRLEGIVHFPHNIKPWHYACSHPQRNLYLHYRKGTPWENVPLDNKNAISFVLRCLPYPLVLFLIKKRGDFKLLEYVKKRFVCS